MDYKSIVEEYTAFEEPIPYGKQGLHLHPIRMKDYKTWIEGEEVLNINKDRINDGAILQMTNLEFMLALCRDDETIRQKFFDVLRICFNMPDHWDFGSRKNIHGLIQMVLFDTTVEQSPIGKFDTIYERHQAEKKQVEDSIRVIIKSKDYDHIVKLIMFQNVKGYDDRYMSPDIENVVKDWLTLKNKNTRSLTLEEKVCILQSQMHMSLEEIKQTTFRKFNLLVSLCLEKPEYQINKLAELLGHLEGKKLFKEPLEHWSYQEDKDILDEALVPFDTVENKFSGYLARK